MTLAASGTISVVVTALPVAIVVGTWFRHQCRDINDLESLITGSIYGAMHSSVDVFGP